MVDFFRQLHQFPRRPKDCFVPLLLPEADVEVTVREFALHESGPPLWFLFWQILRVVHDAIVAACSGPTSCAASCCRSHVILGLQVSAPPQVNTNLKIGFVSLGCPKNLVYSDVMMGPL